MDGYDALVVNPCGSTGLLVARSLQERGVRTLVVEGPSARKDAPGLVRKLKGELERTGARMIIPVFFPEVLSACRSEFPGVLIPVSCPAKIRLLDNKVSACSLASGLGIPQPRIYSCLNEVETFPVVFKRALGQGGDSVYFPGNPRALANLAAGGGEYLVSDFVPGVNVCVDAIRAEGFFDARVYKVLDPPGKGVSRVRESIPLPLAVEYVRRLLDAVDYRGVCGVDFRLSEDGRLWFLECNPRFSGGLQTTLDAGLDLPFLLYSLCLEGRV